MDAEDREEYTTRLTLERGDKQISVEMPGTNLEYTEFMELIELLIINSGYTKHEYESYILEWAADIQSAKNN